MTEETKIKTETLRDVTRTIIAEEVEKLRRPYDDERLLIERKIELLETTEDFGLNEQEETELHIKRELIADFIIKLSLFHVAIVEKIKNVSEILINEIEITEVIKPESN